MSPGKRIDSSSALCVYMRADKESIRLIAASFSLSLALVALGDIGEFNRGDVASSDAIYIYILLSRGIGLMWERFAFCLGDRWLMREVVCRDERDVFWVDFIAGLY